MENAVDWLVKSDPTIVFQTKRDILDLPKKEWFEDQKRITDLGWGKQILGAQSPQGNWKGKSESATDTNNLYTLLLLRRMEMLPNERTEKGCLALTNRKSVASGPQRRELCIASMGMSVLAYFKCFKDAISDIITQLEDRQLEDGGWNCVVRDSHHSSLNTTFSALEGLVQVEKNYPEFTKKVDELRNPAHEFLFAHQLFKSHKTGNIIHEKYIDITFPPDWRYNILSVLDYFRSISYPYDERFEPSLEIIEQRGNNGFWPQGKPMRRPRYIELGKNPSEFNTLRALRVLKYFHQ